MQHSSGRRNAGAAVRIALLFIGGLMVAVGLASPANAGGTVVDPSFSVDTGCVDGQGAITFTLTDGTYTVAYDLSIDGVLVGDGVGEGKYTYKPYAAGDHATKISYMLVSGQLKVDDDTWTVEDCGLASTTTAAPAPSSAPPSAPTTAAPTPAAPATTVAAPTTVASNAAAALPATGRASGNLALIAVLLTAVGGGLLLVVRQARRA